MGYLGDKMSVNAMKALTKGQRPISNWDKESLIMAISDRDSLDLDVIEQYPLSVLRETILAYCGSHHIGKRFKYVRFYRPKTLDGITMEDFKRNYEAMKERVAKYQERKTMEQAEIYAWQNGIGMLYWCHDVKERKKQYASWKAIKEKCNDNLS